MCAVGRSPVPLPVAAEFGKRLRARRNDLGWSIESLAERAGLHWTYVGSVERGERNVSLLNICRLAAAIGCSAGALVEGLEELAAS